jgi:hypothetical protein
MVQIKWEKKIRKISEILNGSGKLKCTYCVDNGLIIENSDEKGKVC